MNRYRSLFLSLQVFPSCFWSISITASIDAHIFYNMKHILWNPLWHTYVCDRSIPGSRKSCVTHINNKQPQQQRHRPVLAHLFGRHIIVMHWETSTSSRYISYHILFRTTVSSIESNQYESILLLLLLLSKEWWIRLYVTVVSSPCCDCCRGSKWHNRS